MANERFWYWYGWNPYLFTNGRSKFPENNNGKDYITKDAEPITEQPESELVGKLGTVTKIVLPIVEKATSQYTDNTDGNPEILKEGEVVGKSGTETNNVHPIVDKASKKSDENTNSSPEITMEGEPVPVLVKKSGTKTKTVPPVVNKASSKSAENTNSITEIHKEGEQAGNSGTATKTVPTFVENASDNSNKNSNGNAAILKEGENIGELHTAMNTLPPVVENESSNCTDNSNRNVEFIGILQSPPPQVHNTSNKSSVNGNSSKGSAISPDGNTNNVSKLILEAIDTLDNSIERELYMATISNEEWRLTYGHHLMEKESSSACAEDNSHSEDDTPISKLMLVSTKDKKHEESIDADENDVDKSFNSDDTPLSELRG